MARKGWDQLSAKYRARLERNGISKSGYERGDSIRSARGHAKTPERPGQGSAVQFPDYWRERNRLSREFALKKERLFGDRPRFSGNRSFRNVRQTKVSMAELRWAIAADESELIGAIVSDAKHYAFIGYH